MKNPKLHSWIRRKSLLKGKTMPKAWLTAWVVAAVVAGGLYAVSRSQAAGFPYFELCGNAGNGRCLAAFSMSNGSLIKMEPNIASDPSAGYQRMKTVQVSYCGGTVTDNCPFRLGSGMNRVFRGNPITEFQFRQDPSKCVGANIGGHYLVVLPCGASGTLWVQNDNYRYGMYGSQINVADTNASGLLIMTSPGVTGQAAYDGSTYTTAFADWGAVYR